MNNYSILINTCDKFEDCWNPFFKLWAKYWSNCTGKIYLNTEYKNYTHNGLTIESLKVCEKHKIPKDKRATWSQCLKWALEGMETDIVLYMQEDYFIKDFVKNDLVEYYVELMQSNPKMNCIHLTDQAVSANGASEYKKLDKVMLRQRYRISCQAALWRKSELLDLIREYENAWEFEEFGSKRSTLLQKDYYVVNQNYVQLNVFEIIPYVFTGIVQGRWFEEVIPLFKKENIDVDFSKRGFVKDAKPKALINKIKYRLNKFPIWYRHQKDMYRLKKKYNS